MHLEPEPLDQRPDVARGEPEERVPLIDEAHAVGDFAVPDSFLKRAPFGALPRLVCTDAYDAEDPPRTDPPALAGCPCQSTRELLAEARLPGGSGERPDSALSAEALGQRLLRLDDESRIELLENSLEGLER